MTGQGSVKPADVVTPYVAEIAKRFNWQRRIKVVVDAGNGAGGPAMHRLLERLNCDTVELFFEPDGRFPSHHPDPTIVENLVQLKEAVKEHKADLGIAFDGDADRVGAVDENGQVVWGDYLLLIFAREILTRKPGSTFIGEVKCSQILYDEIERPAARRSCIAWATR
jgi:phosphomannomutase/phosphoglucomutase